MPRHRTERPEPRTIPPLDSAALERLAIVYVGRYATTRARLRTYLIRKLRERGWAEEGAPPVEPLVEHCAALGYVDDRQFATARAASLGRRGYGARRIGEALRAAGIEEPDAAPARAQADEAAWATAVAFARRRRFGPFAVVAADPDRRRKALGAMLRAGHALDVARKLIDAAPGAAFDTDDGPTPR